MCQIFRRLYLSDMGQESSQYREAEAMKLIDIRSNWRLYATVMIALGLGVADDLKIEAPGFAMWLLGWVGNVPLREAIRAKAKDSSGTIIELVEDILAQVEIPGQPNVDLQADVTGDLPKPPVVVEIKPLP